VAIGVQPPSILPYTIRSVRAFCGTTYQAAKEKPGEKGIIAHFVSAFDDGGDGLVAEIGLMRKTSVH
jgi:hypothetical protein